MDDTERMIETLGKITHTLLLMDANITRMTKIILEFDMRIRRLENGT
jgi:hypothetical protein